MLASYMGLTQKLYHVSPTPGSIFNIPVETSVDVAEVNQQPCLEESELWPENVDQIHLVLTSGTLVVQKKHSTRTQMKQAKVSAQLAER